MRTIRQKTCTNKSSRYGIKTEDLRGGMRNLPNLKIILLTRNIPDIRQNSQLCI